MEKGKGGASRPRPRFWPTGRSRLGPPALSPPPSPRSRPRPRADGLAVTPWRAGRTRPPRGGHAAARTRPGRPPKRPGRARLRPRSHLRPSAPSLSLSRPRPARAERRRRHWSPSSASAVPPPCVRHSSISSSPSFALAPPLRNAHLSAR
jgi:hypothetical protein